MVWLSMPLPAIRFLLTSAKPTMRPTPCRRSPVCAPPTSSPTGAYDTHAILDYAEAIGARPIIPQRSCMNRPRDFDPAIYNQCKSIERTIATRYDHLPANYLASLYLASLSFWC